MGIILDKKCLGVVFSVGRRKMEAALAVLTITGIRHSGACSKALGVKPSVATLHQSSISCGLNPTHDSQNQGGQIL